jgi:hypothetical protein
MPRSSVEQLPGMEILRGGRNVRYPLSAPLRRLILEIWFSCHTLYIAWKYRDRFDRVIAVFPPSLFFYLLRLILPASVIRIGIVHDLQGVLGLSGGGLLKRLFAKGVRHVESIGFKACHRLILLSEGMKTRVLDDYGIDPARCSVHYPFVSEVYAGVTGARLTQDFVPGFKHIVYAGALGDKQAPFSLLALFEALVRSREDVVCHLFSRGPLFEKVQAAVAADVEGRILCHDLVAEDDLPELYARSSLQIIPQKPGTSDGAFPSKLPNLLAAGVPVFAITDKGSELEKLLAATGTCCSISTWDHAELLPALHAFLDGTAEHSHVERARELTSVIAALFSIENLVAEILSVRPTRDRKALSN